MRKEIKGPCESKPIVKGMTLKWQPHAAWKTFMTIALVPEFYKHSFIFINSFINDKFIVKLWK